MFQVTCIRDKTLAQAHPGPAAVRLKLQITLGIPHTVIMPTPLILSVRIRAEKAIKVGMPPAPLNLASKALISKSGPPHDHFNWAVAERCAEWLGLARGLFLTSYSETQLQNCTSIVSLRYEARHSLLFHSLSRASEMLFRNLCGLMNFALCNVFL